MGDEEGLLRWGGWWGSEKREGGSFKEKGSKGLVRRGRRTW